MHLVFLGLAILSGGGMLTWFVPSGPRTRLAAFFAVFGAGSIGWGALGVLLSGRGLALDLPFPFPFETVPFVLDPLAAFFSLLIAVGGIAASLYTISYLKPYEGTSRMAAAHPGLVNLLVAAMVLVVLVQHALAFLVVWEIMSLVSFLLVFFENEKPEVAEASLYYLVAMHVGAVLLTVAFILASSRSGSFLFKDFASGLDTALLVLFFAGFAFKAGFFPLHTWLPLAHPAAPSNVSALMSGVMIKTGLYGILRIFTLGGTASVSLVPLFLILSVVTAVYGIAYALVQKDLKRLLAYSSIENIGIIGLGLSAGLLGCSTGNPTLAFLGFTGGLLHAFNHAIIKPLLFFCAGEVYQAAHTRTLDLLGGLAKKMPGTAACFFIGAASISALPPFNGFTGEFFMYLAFLTGVQSHDKGIVGVTVLLFAALAFVGFLALAAFSMAGGVVFLGEPRVRSRREGPSRQGLRPLSHRPARGRGGALRLFPRSPHADHGAGRRGTRPGLRHLGRRPGRRDPQALERHLEDDGSLLPLRRHFHGPLPAPEAAPPRQTGERGPDLGLRLQGRDAPHPVHRLLLRRADREPVPGSLPAQGAEGEARRPLPLRRHFFEDPLGPDGRTLRPSRGLERT